MEYGLQSITMMEIVIQIITLIKYLIIDTISFKVETIILDYHLQLTRRSL